MFAYSQVFLGLLYKALFGAKLNAIFNDTIALIRPHEISQPNKKRPSTANNEFSIARFGTNFYQAQECSKREI